MGSFTQCLFHYSAGVVVAVQVDDGEVPKWRICCGAVVVA